VPVQRLVPLRRYIIFIKICFITYEKCPTLNIRSVSGGQPKCGGIRFLEPLFGFDGRHSGRTERHDRRHRLARHRLPHQRTATADHVRGKRTTRTSQGMDSDERHGPRRQSGERQKTRKI